MPAVLIGGVGTLLIVVLWMRLFPQLVRVDTAGVREVVNYSAAANWRGSPSASQWSRKSASQARMPWS